MIALLLNTDTSMMLRQFKQGSSSYRLFSSLGEIKKGKSPVLIAIHQTVMTILAFQQMKNCFHHSNSSFPLSGRCQMMFLGPLFVSSFTGSKYRITTTLQAYLEHVLLSVNFLATLYLFQLGQRKYAASWGLGLLSVYAEQKKVFSRQRHQTINFAISFFSSLDAIFRGSSFDRFINMPALLSPIRFLVSPWMPQKKYINPTEINHFQILLLKVEIIRAHVEESCIPDFLPSQRDLNELDRLVKSFDELEGYNEEVLDNLLQKDRLWPGSGKTQKEFIKEGLEKLVKELKGIANKSDQESKYLIHLAFEIIEKLLTRSKINKEDDLFALGIAGHYCYARIFPEVRRVHQGIPFENFEIGLRIREILRDKRNKEIEGMLTKYCRNKFLVEYLDLHNPHVINNLKEFFRGYLGPDRFGFDITVKIGRALSIFSLFTFYLAELFFRGYTKAVLIEEIKIAIENSPTFAAKFEANPHYHKSASLEKNIEFLLVKEGILGVRS